MKKVENLQDGYCKKSLFENIHLFMYYTLKQNMYIQIKDK